MIQIDEDLFFDFNTNTYYRESSTGEYEIQTNHPQREIISTASNPHTPKLVKRISKKCSPINYLEDYERDTNICLSDCQSCSYNTQCDPHYELILSKQIPVALDISSQDPTMATLFWKEPRWVEVFQNSEMRILGLDFYLSKLFDTSLSKWYYFLHHIENNHLSELVELNSLIFNKSENRTRIRELIQKFQTIWNEL